MRSYGQFCALARALDLVGQRWTLLVVRELLLGPRRYGELLDGLPGIGTNLLAQRLRELEDADVVRRVALRTGGRADAYELTEHGRALDGALVELARWGMSPMRPPAADDSRRPGWYALALRAAFRPELAAGLEEVYELTLDGETFHLDVRDGAVDAREGAARDPVLRITAGTEAFLQLATGSEPAALERSGRVEINGSRAALRRWLRAFRLPSPVRPG